MNQSNWHKPEEMKDVFCPQTLCFPDSGNLVTDAFYCEVGKGNKCGSWLWRPCGLCRGSGTKPVHDNGLPYSESISITCHECNGTGHDGSGYGRCGIGRM